MDRRTFLSMLGTTSVALLALSATARLAPVLAKDGSGGGDGGGGGGSGGESGGGGSKDDKGANEEGGNNTDQPGTEAQPEDATECAAGTDCKKK